MLGAVTMAALGAFGCDSAFESEVNPSVVSCQVTASMPSQSIAAAGGRGSLQVSALPECAWKATPGTSWITGISPAAGQGDQQVAFVVAANTSQQARQGDVVINSLRLTVRQDAAPAPPPPPPPPPPPGPAPQPPPPPSCTYTLASTSASIGAGGGALTVALKAGSTCPWSAQSQASWITVTSVATGLGPTVVAIAVAPNTGGPRTGTVAIANQTFTINQGTSCSYALKPERVRGVSAAGATGLTVTVSTSATCGWTAVSNAPWITVTAGAAGTDDGVVTFSVAANTTGANRAGTITIADQTLQVDQDD